MKKIVKSVAILLWVTGVFTACSKNDHEVKKPDNKALVVNTWHLDAIEYYFMQEGQKEKALVGSTTLDDTFVITEDGKMYVPLLETEQYTYTLNGDEFDITENDGQISHWIITALDQHQFVIEQNLGKQTYESEQGSMFEVLRFSR